VLPQPGISAIGLQYVDEFNVVGDPQSFKPSMLFANDGERLPRFVLNQTGAWHNHSGWYKDGGSSNEKILNNVNISVQPRAEKLVVQVIGAHRIILDRAIATTDGVSEILKNHFETLHNENKNLLKELLSQDAQESIHLDNAKC
jgi:uncharacterized protein (TIGR04255 family)